MKRIWRRRREGSTAFVWGKFCVDRLHLKDEQKFDRKSACGGEE